MATVRTSPSLDALVPSWARHLRPPTLRPAPSSPTGKRQGAWARFLDERGMPTEVGSIHPEHVEAFIEDLLAIWSPATAAVRYRILQQLFRWLIDGGQISVSPMARMRPPRSPSSRFGY